MKFAITALVVALVATSAMASSYLWNGPAAGEWITAANWTPLDGGVTFPQGPSDTGIFLSSASVTTTGLVQLPTVNITGTLAVTVPSGTLQSPNNTIITGSGQFKLVSGNIKFYQGASANDIAGGFWFAGGHPSISGSDVIIPATGGLKVTGGNTNVQFMADYSIATGAPVECSGGNINWSTNTQNTLGVLTTNNPGSMNDLNGLTLNFADSSAATWGVGGAIALYYLAGDIPGNIYVGSNANGLTAAQLAKVSFVELDPNSWDPNGITSPAGLDSTGKLVMVPEPMTLSLLLVGGIAGLIRRR